MSEEREFTDLDAAVLDLLENNLLVLASRVREMRGWGAQVEPPSSKTPGERLALARNRARLSQQALSDLSGVSVNAIINFENNRTNPRPRTLMALAEHLDIPWETLKEDPDANDDTHEG